MIRKFAIIGGLILILAFVIIFKEKGKREKIVKEPAVEESQIGTETLQESTTFKTDKNVLAVVNGFKITEDYLKDRYRSLPSEYRRLYKNDMEGFLEQLIIKELLYQEAEKRGFGKDVNIEDIEKRKDTLIEKLITDITEKIKIPEKEMRDFYNKHRSEMWGASFEEVRTIIENHLIQQKRGEVIDRFIEDLKKKADIVRNEEWINKQRALKSKNPLDEALKSGKPTVLDLGSGHCIPCKMMKPIFDELKREYKGKANILLLEISEHRDLARKYRVRVIPTQIFFDKDGKEYWKHEGFLSKDEIVKKLKELGVK